MPVNSVYLRKLRCISMDTRLIRLLVLSAIALNARALFTIDILEVGSNSTMPHLIVNEWEVVRPSRGVFGMSGYIDLKQDIDTDVMMLETKIYYSTNGITYTLTPFRVPRQSVTKVLNHAYKDYLMDSMTKCCKNPPEGDVFVSPLTKRLVECDSCLYPTESFPPAMRPGFYKVVVIAINEGQMAACSMLLKVELDV